MDFWRNLKASSIENHELNFFLILTAIFLMLTIITIPFRNRYLTLIFYIITPIPLVYKILKFEEIKDITKPVLQPWKLHYKAIGVYGIIFFAISAAVAITLIILPKSLTEPSFALQQNTINQINGITGHFTYNTQFIGIINNNLRILFMSLILSLVFGIGSLVILVWNATIFGYVIGAGIKANIMLISSSKNTLYGEIMRTILKYSIHGIPEIISYLIAAFAGGLIYAGILNHNIYSKVFKKVIYDSLDLTVLSIILLIIAGLIESYITPVLFY